MQGVRKASIVVQRPYQFTNLYQYLVNAGVLDLLLQRLVLIETCEVL